MDATLVDRGGLTTAEVAERTAAGQTNAFTADSSRSAWNIVRANVFTLFNGIVFACFFVLFLVGRWQDALFGFAAFANAIIGCVQEFRASGGPGPRRTSLPRRSCSGISSSCVPVIRCPPMRR